jgi:hypothetical protein
MMSGTSPEQRTGAGHHVVVGQPAAEAQRSHAGGQRERGGEALAVLRFDRLRIGGGNARLLAGIDHGRSRPLPVPGEARLWPGGGVWQAAADMLPGGQRGPKGPHAAQF